MVKLKSSFKNLLLKYPENIAYLYICSPPLHFYISLIMFHCIMYFDKKQFHIIMHGLDKQDLGFILIWIKILSLQNKHKLNHIPVVYTGKVKFQENYLQSILFHEISHQSQRFNYFSFFKLSCSVFPKFSLPSFPYFIPALSVQH